MTNEKTNNGDVIETSLEKWEIQEVVDDAVAAGQHNQFMKSEYVYEFCQGGRVVRGLTASAIAHLALVENISIESHTLEKQEDGYFCTATAVKLDTNQKAIGVAFQPHNENGRFDKFAAQKAVTKASRNARKQLLPFTLILSAIDAMCQQTSTTETPAEAKARKRAFAMYSEHKDALPEDFWEVVKAKFGVESRSNMSIPQWNETCKMINTFVANGNVEVSL